MLGEFTVTLNGSWACMSFKSSIRRFCKSLREFKRSLRIFKGVVQTLTVLLRLLCRFFGVSWKFKGSLRKPRNH